MSRIIQVYNPVHGQRIHRLRLNVMGRLLDKKIRTVAVHLDKALIRKVHVANSGAFECRVDLSSLSLGKHEVELRTIIGYRTERLVVPFYMIEQPEEQPSQSGESDDP